jgi:hypothetical protein
VPARNGIAQTHPATSLTRWIRGFSSYHENRPAREHGKGWGLVTVNGVSKGDLIQEYVGEVIDETTKNDRLLEWARDHPNDPNFYVMRLETGWYIDARGG